MVEPEGDDPLPIDQEDNGGTEGAIIELKQQKARAKTVFTRARRQLLVIVQQDNVSTDEIKERCEALDMAQEEAMDIMARLLDRYMAVKDNKNSERLSQEIDNIEIEYSEAQNRAQKVYDEIRETVTYDKFVRKLSQKPQASDVVKDGDHDRNGSSLPAEKLLHQPEYCPEMATVKSHASESYLSDREVQSALMNQPSSGIRNPEVRLSVSDNGQRIHPVDSEMIGQDLWKQLKRVTIPVFSGDKKAYQNWKAAFMACVDQAPATAEYKLLQLRQCLAGDALKAIESLGHSATAYQTAKERLDRKFGGQRRQIALYLEDLDNFRPIRPGNPKDIEKFADLLDVAIVNLKEANRLEELQDGLLYMKLQKKLPATMLAAYHRWIFENRKKESVEVLREWAIQESEFQIRALETIQGMNFEKPENRLTRGNQRTFFGRSHPQPERVESRVRKMCKICSKPHGVWVCRDFKQLDIPKRWECAKKFKLCFRCLGEDHLGQYCNRTRVCGQNGCRELHHRLLHRDHNGSQINVTRSDLNHKANKNEANLETKGRPTETETSNKAEKELIDQKVEHNDTTMMIESTGTIALRTIPVYIRNGNRKLQVNALLDDASTKTYLNADVAAELGLQGCLRKVNVSLLNGKVETFETSPVECVIESLDGKSCSKVTAFTANRVTGNMKVTDWNTCAKMWPHLKGLPFYKLGSKSTVDVLIGLDCSDLHFSVKDIRGNPGEPVARLTPLGWTCVGPMEGQSQDIRTNYVRTYFVTNEIDNVDMNEVNTTLRRFWETDNSGIDDNQEVLSAEDNLILNKAQQSIQFIDGHYRIAIPWRGEKVSLLNNYPMALRRLQNLEKRLENMPEVAQAYKENIKKYIEKGYIRQVADLEKLKTTWYLPHFAVVRADKPSTKTRIVFDASAKHCGISLNDAIYQGPKLQQELFNVLIRFRRFPVALVSDIAEMYLRIELYPQDRMFHRFLWRDLDIHKKPTEYEFNRLVFGVNSLPFLAQLVSRHNATIHEKAFPKAAETVLQSTYMDDSMDSVLTDELGVDLYKQLSELWSKAGMHTHKWLSVVLSKIPLQDRVNKMNLNEVNLPSVSTLGVMWIATEDVFTFDSQVNEAFELTKRNFLKKMATLFDPLGFLSPFVIRAKVLMQELWIHGLDWDEKLPTELSTKIISWFGELILLPTIKVQRCLQLKKQVRSMSLHVFADASEDAYGAVVYQKSEYQDGSSSVYLVASKSKVAPLQSISIPRLELMGAVLGYRLVQTIASVMNIEKSSVTFWIDSACVLYWIREHSKKLKPFVANRISEIQVNTNPDQWRHVPTKMNPADYITRGVRLSDLIKLTTWWYGPDYLKKGQEFWPTKEFQKTPRVMEEVRKRFTSELDKEQMLNPVTMLNFISSTEESVWRLKPLNYSSWRCLTHTFAWVMRFITNCCLLKDHRVLSNDLKIQEIADAETSIIRTAQREASAMEYIALLKGKKLSSQSKLLGLSPRLDDNKIMRSDGRLKYAEFLPYDVRYPIILPRKDWVTKLIVKHYHELGNHNAGVNQTLSHLSSKYWIIAAREEIIEWEKQCAFCKKRKAKNATQIMAPLPLNRLETSLKAFTRVAVDFGGPFTIIQGRGKRRGKRYLCLFTCLTSRAVHLEMAYGLDVDSFMRAFTRMTDRRGLPKEIISDNGTNFVGANKELIEIFGRLTKDTNLKSLVSSKGIKWTFSPPYAPHFGGVFETMIKAAKRAVMAILGNADVTDDELMTAFTGAEALINSRPLTCQSADPEDDIPLTPNHLLHGQIGGRFAPEVAEEVAYSPKKRWRRVQELIRHFWHRWLREWIPSLSPRRKWLREQKNIKIGDVVLLISTDSTRAHWPLGRVIEVYPGKDGQVRSAKLQVGEKQYVRPLVKLCPLELD